MNSKALTEQQAISRLAALCSGAEHCQQELKEKMRRWQLPEEVQARVLQRLKEGRYVDDERYCRAFVHDKVHFARWGRRKVEQALWQKQIDDELASRVLDEVPTEDYVEALRPLLQQKRRQTVAKSDYDMRQKLMRFALGRGFGMDIIRQCMEVSNEDELLD